MKLGIVINQKKYFKKGLWYTIAPLAIFILFKKKIDELLSLLIVKPFLSYVDSYWLIDILILSLCIIVLFFFINKIINGINIPLKWCFIIPTFSIFYLVYRISNYPFSFTSFSFCNQIKLFDIISFTLFSICLISLLYEKPRKFFDENKTLSFGIDEPIKISESNDLLNRLKFIENLALMLANTKSDNGSFPIGIVSPWGSGKTTFLNTLKNEIDKYDFITIELNIWKTNSSDQIIETFFKLLKQSLSPYSISINNKLSEYRNTLMKESKNEFLKGFSEMFFPNESIENQYKNINDEIKQINKKILVLIDDIDRLNKKEIYEVIRLIRNTANFSNIFFVVAYDRNYILNAIEEINSYQSHIFLEKIFQVEFSLPPIDSYILEKEIKLKIFSILTSESKACYIEYIGKNAFYNVHKVDLTKSFISNMRDVVRFVNSFHINYQFLKDEIYFPDFYNLELIRFKHPEIFIEFFRRNMIFLLAGCRKNYYPPKPQTYALKKMEIKNDKNKKPEYILKTFLQENREMYKINDNEIDNIVNSFALIFPQHDEPDVSKWGINSYLTVVAPSMFDRYFRLGIEGRLSEIEFSKARELNTDGFPSAIKNWCTTEALVEQVGERFTQIMDFDSRGDFEKIVDSIFYFANLPVPIHKEWPYPQLNNYDSDSLATLMGREDILKAFYNNDLNRYKSYLLSVFQSGGIEYEYRHSFLHHLLHKGYYSIAHIFSSEEISSILFSYFKKAVNTSNKVKDVWWQLGVCEERIEKSTGHNQSSISYPMNKEAARLFRHFIFEKDLDGYIEMVLNKTPDNTYVLGTYIKELFRSNELFIWLLKKYKGKSLHKETFIKYYEEIKSNPEKARKGIAFDFSI